MPIMHTLMTEHAAHTDGNVGHALLLGNPKLGVACYPPRFMYPLVLAAALSGHGFKSQWQYAVFCSLPF